MTQIHLCTNCKKDALGGGSVVYGGMFFKMCAECFEDEEVIRQMNEYWRNLEENEDMTPKEAMDELVKLSQQLDLPIDREPD